MKPLQSTHKRPRNNDNNNYNIVNNNSTPWLCPQTHFQCPDNGYCLPVFVRCNGVYDCPNREDEVDCQDATCPGYYRCRGSPVCLHPEHVCDGVFQCPQRDDELECNTVCPVHCICLGLAFKCDSVLELRRRSVSVRALDLSGSNATLPQLTPFTMLVYLDMERCQLEYAGNISFPNLQTLSLRKNEIRNIRISDFSLPNLRHLYLSHNPITSLFSETLGARIDPMLTVTSLDLSHVTIPVLDVSVFVVFPNLQVLNLSHSGIERVLDSGLDSLSKLQIFDLRGCAMLEFPPKLFLELENLHQLFGDTYKLCCSRVLPEDFNPSNCHTPVSEISSCSNLLRSDLYRLFLGLFAALALAGNVVSSLFRLCVKSAKKVSGYSVFVTHLCLSDGLMGVYLVVIGVADRVYQNTYLWQDVTWKNSVVCKAAGFMALLSTEMSAFIICLITLDRFLVIRFPFSRVRFQSRSAHVVCCVHWVALTALASVPFFPVYHSWGFYSHTDICIPLPITRSSFAGHNFAFGVMIVLNMILFVAIAAGQTAIYLAIKTNVLSPTDSTRNRQDLDIARRLLAVAVTDFLCWFPVGLLGLLASTGTAVPGEVNVAMATLVIPLNSAMNPFLYTMNVLLEKRRQAREERIFRYLQSLASTA